MTREEAIKRLREILAEAADYEMLVYGITEEDKEILKMAIKALEQEPCADCISRETLLKYLETITKDTNPRHYESKDKWYHDNGFNLCKVRIEKFVKNLAPATPQLKIGQFNDVFERITNEILVEAGFAYADFDEYKKYILHIDPDDLPDDDFRYGLRRAAEIINKHKAKIESEE